MKSWTQGCALEARVEVVAVSKAISKGPRTHAWPLEALQNAAPVSQISKEAKGMFALLSRKAKGKVFPDINQASDGNSYP